MDKIEPKDDLVERVSDEADLCRNDGADDIAKLLDDAKARIEAQAKLIEGLQEGLEDIAGTGRSDFPSHSQIVARTLLASIKEQSSAD